tara:strand:- start:1606 stop:2916 length:1311 start_codon:yes stop_codon:yes gene_type:complete
MSISYSTTPLLSSGSISFTDLNNTFGGHSTGENIKFSTYFRDTSDAISPIVPDSTENQTTQDVDGNVTGIAAKNSNGTPGTNLEMHTFRNSNKEVTVSHTGTTYMENVEYENYFNNNLTKNIPKNLSVSGRAVSADRTDYAAQIDVGGGNIRNLNMNLNSGTQIYGTAGNKDQNGGTALYIASGGSDRNFRMTISGSAQIWGGGGGGNDGSNGSSVNGTCNWREPVWGDRGSATDPDTGTHPSRNVNYGARSGSGRGCGGKRGARIAAPSHGPQDGNVGPGKPNRKWIRGWSGRRGRSRRCRASYNVTYPGLSWVSPNPPRAERVIKSYRRRNNTITGPGGSKGTGGIGQGWSQSGGSIQSKTNGNSGNRGNSASCRSPYSGPTVTGNDGSAGNPGGAWGQNTPNTNAGKGIYHRSRITFSGSTTNPTIKGGTKSF